jgi:hypothetical protein
VSVLSKIRIIIVLFLLVVAIFLVNLTFSANDEEEDNNIEYFIIREDHTIKSEDDVILALVYYDRLLILGNSDVAVLINNFFENEYRGWMHGANRLNYHSDNWMSIFLERVQEMRDAYGDDIIAMQPLYYTVNTEVVYLCQDILSVRQEVQYFAGGSSGSAYHGSTFNLRTGERISFDSIADVDADEFRENLSAFLIDFLGTTGESEIMGYYGPNEPGNFDIYYDGHLYQLNYEFFYDGEYFYIPERFGIYRLNAPEIIRWNGKIGNDFRASFVCIEE